MLNLTPHPITIAIDGRDPVTIQPSGTVARVETTEIPRDKLAFGDAFAEEVPVISRRFGEVTGLPDDPAVACLVSSLVLSAIPGRPNTFAPDTGPTAIRDEKGHIVAVTRLVAA